MFIHSNFLEKGGQYLAYDTGASFGITDRQLMTALSKYRQTAADAAMFEYLPGFYLI